MPFSVPPLCLWPERLRGKSWNRIPMEELACQPIVKAVDVLVQVHAGQSATLSCQVTGSFITHEKNLTHLVVCFCHSCWIFIIMLASCLRLYFVCTSAWIADKLTKTPWYHTIVCVIELIVHTSWQKFNWRQYSNFRVGWPDYWIGPMKSLTRQ